MKTRTFEQLEPRCMMAVAVQVPFDGFFLSDLVPPENEPAALVTGPTNGRGDITPEGVVGYAPDYGYRGQDTMQILAGGRAETITFVVGNRAPVTVDDSYATTVNTPIVEVAPGFLVNDSDPDGDTFTAAILDKPANGVALCYSTGQFMYWPDEDFVGADSFTYEATDQWGLPTVGTVSITVSVPTSSVTHTFEIANTGTADLLLTGAPPVQIVGVNASDFVVTRQPSIVVSPGGVTEFDIRFEPTEVGVRIAEVVVPNNDDDEDPYNFAIQGEGVAGDVVEAISLEVVDGDLVDAAIEKLWDGYWLPFASGAL